MLPVLVVPSPLPRRHFGAAAGGVHPIITPVLAPAGKSRGSCWSGPRRRSRPGRRDDLRAGSRSGTVGDSRHFTRERAAGEDPPAQSGGRKAAVPATKPPKVDPKPTAASRNATGPCSEPATSSPRRATSEQSRAHSTARPSATPARPFASTSSGKGGRRTTLSPGVRPSTARGGPRFRAPPTAGPARKGRPPVRDGRHGHGNETGPV